MTDDTDWATVMIIDDEPENLNVLEASLSDAGYRTALFPRGTLALAAAQEQPPDLVLLDIRMPGMDGREVCRRFKADERLRMVPVIFISALSAAEDIIAGFEWGGVDYIAKPFREPEVLARVRTHVVLRRAHARVAEQLEHLHALEQHRERLVHLLVNDMRNPLQAILGQVESVELSCDSNLAFSNRESLRSATVDALHLSRMVSTVLDLNRMEREKVQLRLEAMGISEILSTLTEASESALGANEKYLAAVAAFDAAACPFEAVRVAHKAAETAQNSLAAARAALDSARRAR